MFYSMLEANSPTVVFPSGHPSEGWPLGDATVGEFVLDDLSWNQNSSTLL